MKNHLSKVLVTLLALGIVSQANAWTYSFTNHTSKTVVIGMKYQGTNEPLEQRIIPSNERRQFKPGEPMDASGFVDISPAKVGFVVDKFYYMQDPQFTAWYNKNGRRFNPQNIRNAPWRALSVTWVPSDKYTATIELMEAVGDTLEAGTKAGIKAGAAYATGGASLAAEAAQAAASNLANAEVAKELADNDYSIGKFLSAIGKVAGYSWVRSRHIDIVEDENGNLKFLTLLSK